MRSPSASCSASSSLRGVHRTTAAIASAALVVAYVTVARAEDPEAADGIDACKALAAKNDRELAAWEKAQPASPYVYPREDLVLGAPWEKFFRSVAGSSGELV